MKKIIRQMPSITPFDPPERAFLQTSPVGCTISAMPPSTQPLGGPERTAFIMSRISMLIAGAVLQAEIRRMPRKWQDAVPQLGDFTYPDFFEKHKGQIIDEYLRFYCKYWGRTPAGPSKACRCATGGLRLFDYRNDLDDAVKACVQGRHALTSWDEIASHFTAMGHDLEDLGRHKYYILDRFLAHWADSVSKAEIAMQLFLPNNSSSVHGTADSVYVVAGVQSSEPMISRRLVKSIGLILEARDNRITLDCRVVDSPHLGQTARMTFGIVEAGRSEISLDGVAVSNDMDWWIMQRRHVDIEEVEMEVEEEMEGS